MSVRDWTPVVFRGSTRRSASGGASSLLDRGEDNSRWGAGLAACRLLTTIQVEPSLNLTSPKKLMQTRTKSRDHFERASKSIPGGVNSPARAFGGNAKSGRSVANFRQPARMARMRPSRIVPRSSAVLAVGDADVVAAVRFIRKHAHLPLRVADMLRQVAVGRRTLERRWESARDKRGNGEAP